MFESLTGTYTSYDSEGIIDNTLSLALDFYKNWIITIDSIEYNIIGNTTNKILFTNNLTSTGTYKIDFITRSLLTKYESKLDATTNRVSDDLLNNKFEVTKSDFTQIIKSRFKNLYFNFSEEENPLDLIYNLYEIQVPFIYYMLSSIFRDLIALDGDINCIKEQNYKSLYTTILKEAITLLAVDENKNNEIDNIEQSHSIRKGHLLMR